MSSEQTLVDILGNVGGDAEVRETKIGDKVSFSVAVPQSFGDDGVTRWVQVAVFDERRKDDRDDELSTWQKRVLKAAKKGTKIGVKGVLSKRNVDGKTFYDMIAKQVFLLDLVQRGDSGSKGSSKKASSDDEEDGEDLGW